MDRRPTLVYILSASHSGSTLLAILLNAHPSIVTAGELKATTLGDPTLYRCSCLLPIVECGFWRAVHEEMHHAGHEFEIWNADTNYLDVASRYARLVLSPLHRSRSLELARNVALSLSPTWQKHIRRMRVRNRDLIHAIAKVSGKKYIVESSKNAIRLKFTMRLPDVDVRVIRLIRDGRAVMLTYMNPGQFADAKDAAMRGGGFGNASRHRNLSASQAAREWRRSNEEAEELIRTIPPESFTEVSYEELCESPLRTINRLTSFLGLESINTLEEFRQAEHHVIGNGMRLDCDSAIVLDDRWERELSTADLSEFNLIAGDLNRKYGYA